MLESWLSLFEFWFFSESELRNTLGRFCVRESRNVIFESDVRTDEQEQFALLFRRRVFETAAELLRVGDEPFAVVDP